MRSTSIIAMLLCCAGIAGAGSWNLSGKVVDAEEGNGLGSVEVSLASAGIRVTTAKNGDWSISEVVGVEQRAAIRAARAESFLHLENGHLALRMNGTDLLGRRTVSGLPTQELAQVAGAPRTLAAVDTLVYTKEGFVQKRVPLLSSSLTGIRDSIHRVRYEGWVDSSHSNGFKPDTTDAFYADSLRKITFKFSKRNWDSLFKVMSDSCGKFGSSSGGGWGASTTCQVSQYDFIDNNALIWVPVDIYADGQVWKNVAIRLKGNASLQTAWTSGSYSLPFRINTDKLEDTYPESKNQRFHGFKKLSFYTAQQDSTSIRGPIASKIFREAGVVTPITVPVQIFLDRGDDKPLDIGLYEMVEVPDNPLLNRHFGNDSGNLYKPLSTLEKFTQSEWEDDAIKGDYSDAKKLIEVINATNRTSDSATWHKSLQTVFDVEGFLNWLAVSTAIMNWDAYGQLAHNYFLFNDSGTFRFITYDFGWSFDYTMNQLSRTTIWYDGSNGGWYGKYPLIKNLLADKVYCEKYRAYMVKAIAGPASSSRYEATLDHFAKLVAFNAKASGGTKLLRGFMDSRYKEINTSLSAKSCPIPAK